MHRSWPASIHRSTAKAEGEGAVALVMLSPLRSARGELLVSVGSKVTARRSPRPGANGSALALSFQSIETLLGTAPLQARAEQGLDGYAAIEPSAHALEQVEQAAPR